MRIVTTACLAAVLTPLAAAGGSELKPKLGDIGGIFYAEVSGDREACRQAIRNKIALCRQNTSFASNTENRKYPGCLPIFEQQAETCVAHFRRQTGKCGLSGPARIDDFTGFACEVTATVVQEGGRTDGAPGIAPADRLMQARARSNLRAGPGADHARIGLLEAGEEVRVTGEAGKWLRIEAPGGGAAFVHGSLLVEPRPASQGPGPSANREEIAAVRAQIVSAERGLAAARAKRKATFDNCNLFKLAEKIFGEPLIISWSDCMRDQSRSDATCASLVGQLHQELQSCRAELMRAEQQIDKGRRHLRTLREREADLIGNSR